MFKGTTGIRDYQRFAHCFWSLLLPQNRFLQDRKPTFVSRRASLKKNDKNSVPTPPDLWDSLVGGWTNPFEKICKSQNGFIFPKYGWKWRNIWNQHPVLVYSPTWIMSTFDGKLEGKYTNVPINPMWHENNSFFSVKSRQARMILFGSFGLIEDLPFFWSRGLF